MSESSPPLELPSGVDPTDVFLFDPRNEDFLAGKAPRPPSSADVTFRRPSLKVRMIVILGAMGAGILAAIFKQITGVNPFPESGQGRLAGGFLVAILAVGAAMVAYWRAANSAGVRDEREKEGQLLEGRVAQVTFNGSNVTVKYLFRAPSGEAVRASHDQSHADYHGREPPASGTKLLVLYVDDYCFRVL